MPIHAQAAGGQAHPCSAPGRPRVESVPRLPRASRPRGKWPRRGEPRRARCHLRLMRRGPEELFQVYTEDDFLGGAGLDELGGATHISAEDRRLRRMAGAAMLVGALGTVVGVVLVNASSPVAEKTRAARAGSRERAYGNLPGDGLNAAARRFPAAPVRGLAHARRRSRGESRPRAARRTASRAVAAQMRRHEDVQPATSARYVASPPAAAASAVSSVTCNPQSAARGVRVRAVTRG